MLAKARMRGIYDELICDELVAAMAKWGDKLDLAISADVFVYVCNLEPVFKACARILKPGGLLAFTVEEQDGAGFVLEGTCRYRHSRPYLEALALAHGFTVLRSENVVPRYNFKEPVPGLLTILRRN